MRAAGIPGARLISAHTGEGMKELLDELWTHITPAATAAMDAEIEDGHDG